MRYVGIDPGFSGAIAAIYDDRPAIVLDMPVLDVGNPGEMVDAAALRMMLLEMNADLVTIEYAQAMPRIEGSTKRGMGATSAFKFGKAYGQILACVQIIAVRWQLVTPAKWKNFYGIPGKDKERARALALQKFPELHPDLARKRDHNRAEALLIAQYGKIHAHATPKPRAVRKAAPVGAPGDRLL